MGGRLREGRKGRKGFGGERDYEPDTARLTRLCITDGSLLVKVAAVSERSQRPRLLAPLGPHHAGAPVTLLPGRRRPQAAAAVAAAARYGPEGCQGRRRRLRLTGIRGAHEQLAHVDTLVLDLEGLGHRVIHHLGANRPG